MFYVRLRHVNLEKLRLVLHFAIVVLFGDKDITDLKICALIELEVVTKCVI